MLYKGYTTVSLFRRRSGAGHSVYGAWCMDTARVDPLEGPGFTPSTLVDLVQRSERSGLGVRG